MAATSLGENLFDDGQKLVEELPRQGFEVTAAFWIKAAEDDQWYFYTVSPAVENEGLAQAYRRLHTLIRQMPPPFWIDPLEVKLIGPDDPIARDVLAVLGRAPGPKGSPIRWGGKRLGNVNLEGAYLYPSPVPTP
jgi:hypothetical protein